MLHEATLRTSCSHAGDWVHSTGLAKALPGGRGGQKHESLWGRGDTNFGLRDMESIDKKYVQSHHSQ